jgi:sn-glycerol 3-phosphate transport system substrate-binding protein
MRSPRRTLLTVACALALIAAACGGSDDEGGGGSGGVSGDCPVDALDDATGPLEVVLWHSYVGKTKQTLDKLADLYNASQDKVTVVAEAQGASYEELLRKFQQAIPTGDLPGIIVSEDTTTQFMRDSGAIVMGQDCYDADPDAAEQISDMLPAVRAAYSADDRLIPATMNVSTIVLYYNKDHFVEAGLDPEQPPTTLDEVKVFAEAIKAVRPDSQPVVLKLDPWFVEHWTTGVGQTVVDQDNGRSGLAENGTFDNETTAGVYDWMVDMNAAGLLNGVPGTEGQINHYLAVAAESGSMLFETSTAITTIDGVIAGNVDPIELGLDPDQELPAVSINVGVGLNPGIEEPGKGQVGGGAWYIANTNTDEIQAAAWDFVKYFIQTDSQVLWTMEGSYLPILSSALEDPALQADWTSTDRGRWTATAYEGLTTLDPEFPGPLIGPYDKFRATVRSSMDAVILNGEDVTTQLNEANSAITDELVSYADTSF